MLHEEITTQAIASSQSLNKWVEKALTLACVLPEEEIKVSSVKELLKNACKRNDAVGVAQFEDKL